MKISEVSKRYNYTCCKCPECFVIFDTGFSIPDRNSDTCKACATYHNFMAEVFGVCEITGEYCLYEGSYCGPNCPIWHEEGA